jgi:hypothetical protein
LVSNGAETRSVCAVGYVLIEKMEWMDKLGCHIDFLWKYKVLGNMPMEMAIINKITV